VVETEQGKVRGKTILVPGATANVSVFLGIPFAESTAYPNRWKPPVPKSSWRDQGMLDATSYGPCCPSDMNVTYSEDCLSLNIWMPAPALSALNQRSGPAVLSPVLVWIYGGGFVSGCSNDPDLDGTWFAGQDGIIAVTINYRVGALGFLDTPSLGTGNYGMMDQQLALQWVRTNIAAFGGDPNQVTILGQSAGAMSTTLHLLMPSSFGLYQRAIVESNPVGVRYRTPEQDVEYSNKFATNCGCITPNNVTCLMNLDVPTIIKEQGWIEYVLTPLPIQTTMFLVWAPNIDGNLIPAQPIDMLAAGQFNNVPVIWGTTQNETDGFIPDYPFTCEQYTDVLHAFFGVGELYREIYAEYPCYNNDGRSAAQLIGTDYMFGCSTRYAATCYANFSTTPTYVYQWLQVTVNNTQPQCIDAACHACEIPYVWETLSVDPNHPSPIPYGDLSLSNTSNLYWSSFAHGMMDQFNSNSGVPNNPIWPWYNYTERNSIYFIYPVELGAEYRASYCDFWDSIGYIF